MKQKYFEGQEVKIKKLKDINRSIYPTFVDKMMRFCGERKKIKNININTSNIITYNVAGWWFNESWFEDEDFFLDKDFEI